LRPSALVDESRNAVSAGRGIPGTDLVGGLPGTRPLEQVQREFRDPSLEGRRLFAEAFGTFLLVLVAAGGPVVNAVSGGKVSLAAQVTAPGLMVMAIILFMGATSGAHLNPAVSISFAARGDFPWRRVPGYIAAQLVGALLACLLLSSLFGQVGSLGATNPGSGITDLQALVIELILTVGLVSTILGTASRAQNIGPLAAIAVGGYIVLAGLWAAPISGASMNPARSLGPALVLGNLGHVWVYVVGPILGGLLAVGIAYILRGPGGDQPAILAAQGRLPEILQQSSKQPSEGTDAAPAVRPAPRREGRG
jgi:aquaporin Z